MGCIEAISASDADCAIAPNTTITMPHANASGPPFVRTALRFLRQVSDEAQVKSSATYKA